MSKAITFDHVNKSYGKQIILDDISLSVESGEFIGLVGVNGAGKTTLIKSMLDFTDINSGSVKIQNVDHHKTSARSSLAYLPERFNPPMHLNGDNFIEYMLELHQLPYNKLSVKSVLKKLDFDVENLSKLVHHYSKGMVQKLGLASVFLSDKPLLILDEPMSGLDPKARMHLKEYLLLLKQQKATVFISTHLLMDAAVICDRLIVLHNTRIVYQGSPKGFLKRYHSDDYDTAFVNCISE